MRRASLPAGMMASCLGGLLAILLAVAPAMARAEEPPKPSSTLPALPAGSIAIPEPLLEKVALYLQERPYREVAPLLAALQQAVHDSPKAAPR